ERRIRPLAAAGREHVAAGADRDEVELTLLGAPRAHAHLPPPRADVVRLGLAAAHVLAADAFPAGAGDERVKLRHHGRAQMPSRVSGRAQARAVGLDEAEREVEEAVADRVARALRSRAG